MPTDNLRLSAHLAAHDPTHAIHEGSPVLAALNDAAEIPDGWAPLTEARVYVSPDRTQVVVTCSPYEVWPDEDGEHSDESPHNCDAMGCGIEHVIAVASLEAHDAD